MAAHFQEKYGKRQCEPDPETPRHIGQFRIRADLGSDDQRLERHAADLAGSRADLAYFGMHRTGEDGAFRCGRYGVRAVIGEIARGVRLELRLAAAAAEVER